MKWLIGLLVLLGGGVAWAAFAVPTNAATVNGSAISQDSLNAQVHAIAGSAEYQCYLNSEEYLSSNGSQAGLPPVTGAGTGQNEGDNPTANNAFVATYLDTVVGHELVEQLAATHNVTVNSAQLTDARANLANQITGVMQQVAQTAQGQNPRFSCGAVSPLTGEQVLGSLPSWFADEQVQFVATASALQEDLAGVGASRGEPPGLLRKAPARSSTPSASTRPNTPTWRPPRRRRPRWTSARRSARSPARPRRAGRSRAPSWWRWPASWAPSISTLDGVAVGKASAPISVNGNYVVLELSKRTPTPYATAKPIVEQAVQEVGARATQAAITKAERHASVQLDPRYGTWVPVERVGAHAVHAGEVRRAERAGQPGHRLHDRTVRSAAERGRPPPRRRGGPGARRHRSRRARRRGAPGRPARASGCARPAIRPRPPSRARRASTTSTTRRPPSTRSTRTSSSGWWPRPRRRRRSRSSTPCRGRPSWPSAPSSSCAPTCASRSRSCPPSRSSIWPGPRSASTRSPRASGSWTRPTSPTWPATERGPFLVAQCWSRHLLSEVKLASGDEAAATPPRPVLLHHLGLDDEMVAEVDWWELDRTLEPDHLTSLYVPRFGDGARRGAGAEVARLVALMDTLREQCPWDRAQDHASLMPHLVEECYEVLDALSALVRRAGLRRRGGQRPSRGRAGRPLVPDRLPRAPGGRGRLLRHGRGGPDRARQAGAPPSPRLRRRGGRRRAARSMANWEEIKRSEKGRASVTEGIPAALPALVYASKLARKARSVGVEPHDHGGERRPPRTWLALARLAERATPHPDDPLGARRARRAADRRPALRRS